MIYHCCDQLRRNAVANHPTLNGIDYLEVLDHDAPTFALRQRTLLVRLLKPVAESLTRDQLIISGGERVREVGIEWVAAASAPPDTVSTTEKDLYTALPEAANVLLVRTDRYGDNSIYTLKLVRSVLDETAPEGFDPRLCEVAFSFKVECESDFDCRPVAACPQPPVATADIDYLAKDYSSFRRLILDRMTQLVPGWRERSAADLGVTLAELIAYVGDTLSYQQDAVATEAYLSTARRRASLRRHALLVDYHLHDGCNARVWLHLRVDGEVVLDRLNTRFYSRLPGVADRIALASKEDDSALRAMPLVFEPMHDSSLHPDHNELYFYNWGDLRCCLPAGATRATLAGHWPHLKTRDVLLFEEVIGPVSGEAGDADPAHRHVLRLTSVRIFADDGAVDPPVVPLTDPLTGTEITEIAWAAEDRLPFPLCISSVTDGEHGESYYDKVSVVRGNMVLADHGFTLSPDEELGAVPQPHLAYPDDRDLNRCQPHRPPMIPARFRPELARGPLTFAGTVLKTNVVDGVQMKERVLFDPHAPASSARVWDMEESMPQIWLTSSSGSGSEPWHAARDLLNSDANSREFVVEVEHDGRTRLRFGDDVYGRRPESGTVFTGCYRVGNGSVGNVGAGGIAHVVNSDARILSVRNPLPAFGGVDMEEAAAARRRAPQAFRRQERAVTPEDYAEVTERYGGIQRAAATMRWTGSWHTVFVTVDRAGGLPVSEAFEKKLAAHVERYRMAGHDTEFNDPVYVPLEIELLVCVKADYFRADTRMELLRVLGSSRLPDGRRGLFHPDNLSFGQTVYLSRVYAVARQVPGVASVNATCFQRQDIDDPRYLDDGCMVLSRLEIPRLDNDPDYPEHGVLRLNLYGGK